MKIYSKSSTAALCSIILLSGCKDSSNKESINYTISADKIGTPHTIEREYNDGFDLDNILLRGHNLGFDLINDTPRTISYPTVNLNGDFYVLETTIEPFSTVTIDYPNNLDEHSLTLAQFHDNAPFFRANVTYFQPEDDDGYDAPTEEEVIRFQDEMLSQKYFANRFDLNLHFLHYQHVEDPLRIDASPSDYECDFEILDSLAAQENDQANFSAKLVNLRARKPTAYYRILVPDGSNVLGRATIGNGWLSIRESRLNSGNSDVPSSIYEHEKLHNHGFNHSGNMTYGWSDEFPRFIQRHNIDFYDMGKQPENSGLIQTTDYSMLDDEHSILTLRWASTEGKENISIDSVLIANNQTLEIVEGGTITPDGKRYPVKEVYSYDEASTKVWQGGFEIPANQLNDLNNLARHNEFYFIYKTPINNQASFIISSQSSDGNYSANSHFIHSTEQGISDDTFPITQFAYLAYETKKDDEGIYKKELMYLSPEEAELFCQDRGLQLGVLHPYKSTEMMDFQSRYDIYGSQVGLSAEDMSPVAVNVPTTYRPNNIHFTDKGTLIVCRE